MISSVKILISPSTDVFFNQGVELDLFDSVRDGEYILYLWANDGAVVIGRNQRAKAEVNLDLLLQDGKVLARRLSGGGAVYHDKGNLNFTFIAKSKDFDLSKNRRVVLDALKSLGYEATLTGRNDVEVEGHKVSGNAYYKRDGKELHHGTLLISSSPQDVGKYLTPSDEKFDGKAVRSVVSRVGALNQFNAVTTDQVVSALVDKFQLEFGVESLAEVVTCRVESEDFFRDKNWRYGADRPYDKTLRVDYQGSRVTLHLDLDGKKITSCLVESDSLDADIHLKISKEILYKNLDTDCGGLLDRIKEEIYGI
jgi:lipoate-protein ligase A